ncbi:MAG: C69 family dipeptidase [Bacteroidales bacterium]|nr:C69 family dipeptidase [Bacteroidales bacterium]MCF8405422.1 C69 family dipeptidase [Bacteroidales bacterium]
MNKRNVLALLMMLLATTSLLSQIEKSDWMGGVPEGCTSITAGKLATVDGSVITSHTDDSHRTRSWMDIQPAKTHKAGATTTMYKRVASDSLAMPTYAHLPIGEIPQVKETFGFVNTAYPCMNTKQLAIGESTFGGREELQSDKGLIDCQRLCQLMLERCSTAREAIKMADELTKKYGWNDAGECLTIADKKEVWHFEIVGPGKDKVGAVWAAQRVPDEHISVNANASTIKEMDLNNKDFFMASENIFTLAKENGYWNGKKTFRFNYVYAPHSRESVASRRREWRVFDLLAPSLNLHPDDKDFPFSVKPDKKLELNDIVNVFKDYYQDTPYDMRRLITDTDEDGKTRISPLANPFMPYDHLNIQNVNGGWYSVNKEKGTIRFLGERTIARWYTMYATIIQCRDWLPDEIGGVVWLAQDNVASSIYIPIYCSVTDLPDSYKTPGRPDGFTRESAWWAFNRLGTLAAQRWGDMHKDIDAVWEPWQKELFDNQKMFEAEALQRYNAKNPEETIKLLNGYTMEWGNNVVNKAWELGDFLWTNYDEKF